MKNNINCCICLEDKNINHMAIYECKHSVCMNCFILQNYENFGNNIEHYNFIKGVCTCPMCRSESLYINLTIKSGVSIPYENSKGEIKYFFEYIDYKYYERSKDTFKKILKYLKIVKNNQNTMNILNTILSIYNSFKPNSKLPLLFSIDEVESLLIIVKEKQITNWDVQGYKLYNMLTSLCCKPWYIDQNLGSHGVCYHGNMGSNPGIIRGIKLTKFNVEFLRGERIFY